MIGKVTVPNYNSAMRDADNAFYDLHSPDDNYYLSQKVSKKCSTLKYFRVP